MSRLLRSIPPLAVRLAAGRPVLAQEQVMDLTKRVLSMTSAPMTTVQVSHTARVVTRIANGQVLSSDDGDTFTIELWLGVTPFSHRTVIRTNQLDDSVLHAIVHQCEAIDREQILPELATPIIPQVPDTLIPVRLWHDETVRAMSTSRGTVVPALIEAGTQEGLRVAGFLGFMAHSQACASRDGISVYHEETDSELTLTVRSRDGTSSGWGGQAARNWSVVNAQDVAAHAVTMTKLSANPVAIEPGRRTAILSPAAVAQMIRWMAEEFNAERTDRGGTGFSKTPSGSKLGRRVFDARISMNSDPNDPDGGYCPYFDTGYGSPAMSWIEHGVLKNLAYLVSYAMTRGKPYTNLPYSIRMSGGTTSIDEMIASCKEGIYVNRLSSTNMVSLGTGLTTGVTRDGCFLIRNGKIDRPVKNFRILESPFYCLNNIEALGVPVRAALGYTPPPRHGDYDPFPDWPRPPIIVPPMMIRDFNFSALVDAI